MSEPSFQAVLSLSEVRSRIFAVIVAMVHDYDLAEDLFQETIAEVLRSESRFDPTQSFAPWACGIARNVVRQHWRRAKNAPATGVCELLSELAEIVEDAEDDRWRSERRSLRRCFQRLPDRMQQLLILRYGHNLKGKQLAESTTVRAGSIRTTLSRLRSQLSECVRLQSLDAEAGEA